ncbi:MAG TPA: trehalase family glycosidase [Acidimicrobiia bacterium]|nr:trehalase family glycosidase [Acidimicrobiia bacterium]
MDGADRAALAETARRVLDENRRGTWTCPSSELYPHQWLWDSCFIAIGLARVDPARAADELRALLRGQWSNGMIPHMVFADGHRDLGSRHLWQSRRFPAAPRDVATSCITQPPLPSVAVEHVARFLTGEARRSFLTDMYPALVKYHAWLYRERDPDRTGLVTLIHPWECGLDTTPTWMRTLARWRGPAWLRVVLRLRLARVVRFLRSDTKYIPAAERSSDDDGLRMLALVHHAKRAAFDLGRLAPRRSVLLQDLAFNSLLAVANRALESIAETLDETIDPDLRERLPSTAAAIEGLWDDSRGRYGSRDVVADTVVTLPTVATFLPLWAGIAPERRVRLLALLAGESGFWPEFPIPSVPTDARRFDASRYWKGPTWVNTNWLVVQGLRASGAGDIADELRERTLDMVHRAGCFEYFSPLTGEGIGAADFSWTAALVLDLLAD